MLPVLERREEIAAAITSHQVVILCGQTGSGKTTQLPQICLDLGRGKAGMIGHTQPRRIAARAVAARIAEERGVRLGGVVGFAVRFQDQTSRDTRIKVMTDGVLLAELAGDPLLRAYDTLIIDEAHERSLNIDFLLGCLVRLLPQRPDLKLIITSATIDTDRFSKAFGGSSSAPVIEVSGRMYPVEISYRPGREERSEEVDVDLTTDAIEELARSGRPAGDVLVFLPGEREIRQIDQALQSARINADVLPLYSRLTSDEQDRIFHPTPGRRRVILSTNVAETSLTVPGIRYVVDTGLARINRYDPARKIQGLPIEPISQASANQRAGRCGRVAEGVCIRLYSEESFRARPTFTDPEIRRSSLAGVILRMKSAGLGAVETFPFLDPPAPSAIRDGYDTLFELGALEHSGHDASLTSIGRDMARVPMDPRIARMLLAADEENAVEETIILAAALEIQDPRQRPMGRQDQADRAHTVFAHPTSDFLTLLNIWDQYRHAGSTMRHGALADWCREHFLSPPRMREWTEMAAQLRGVAAELKLRSRRRDDEARASPDAIHRALLTGLITHVACREGDGSFDYRGVRGNTVQIFPGSVLFKKGPKWIMAAEIVQTTRLYARTVARIEPEWIEELAGHMFRRQLSDPHLDAETGDPSAWARVTMSGIVVVPRRRVALAPLDPAQARSIFIRDGLVLGRWNGDVDFVRRNRQVLASAKSAEARLRRRNLERDEDDLAGWFDKRLPPQVHDPASLLAWLAASPTSGPTLELSPTDVLRPEAGPAFDPAQFPSQVNLGSLDHPVPAVLDYQQVPGQDHDGITATVTLLDVPRVRQERVEWLVPGMLSELIASLFKALPKAVRIKLEERVPLAQAAAACTELVSEHGQSLAHALTEAVSVLYDLTIAPEDWTFNALPAHLRLRLRIIDDHGKELAAARDLGDLRTRLAGRLAKAQAAKARATFERSAVTSWDFDHLPEVVESPTDDQTTVPRFPAILDEGESVRLTLLDSQPMAAMHSAAGIRRLFALAARDELEHHLAALPNWQELSRQFAALGPSEQFRTDLAALIAERAFMAGQSPVRSKSDFEDRLASSWGRLTACTREVADVVSRTLEPRFRVAHRISGGTPRLWAASVADIREHAVYLMPRGFLHLVPWERLRHYPRYAEGMRARLFALREDGSRAETDALTRFAPHWKRFTGWVAAAMTSHREASAELGDQQPSPSSKPGAARVKAPLPQARRAAPTVNLDAGEWALQPGHLTLSVQAYRWLLEEFRLTLFAPELASSPAISASDVEEAWKRVDVKPR